MIDKLSVLMHFIILYYSYIHSEKGLTKVLFIYLQKEKKEMIRQLSSDVFGKSFPLSLLIIIVGKNNIFQLSPATSILTLTELQMPVEHAFSLYSLQQLLN